MIASVSSAAADIRALPFADRSIDIVICSQLLHHFAERDAVALVHPGHRWLAEL